jgi:hypothetical protein
MFRKNKDNTIITLCIIAGMLSSAFSWIIISLLLDMRNRN